MSSSRSLRYVLALATMLIVTVGCSSATPSTEAGAPAVETSIEEAATTRQEPADAGAPAEPEPEPERTPVPDDAVATTNDQGPGWRLVGAEVGRGQPYEVALATSELALDRAADEGWFEARPSPDFAEEIVIILTPAVSGSCPDIIFDGLSITDDRVYGRFEPGPPPEGATTCTSDANPIAFVFLVERQALPEVFTLSVEEEIVCGGCERAELVVDLADEAALELALWGTGTFDIVIDGTPPTEGRANVFRWADQEALMLGADVFTDLPRWIQGFPGDQPRTIEAFVVDCGPRGCAEECDDETCQDLVPLGGICSYRYEPEPFVDRRATITWTDVDCEIVSSP